jgi:CHAT domain-containing protein/Tfp pilus assembly protein PilF
MKHLGKFQKSSKASGTCIGCQIRERWEGCPPEDSVMVRFSRSSAWLCSIALITTAISLPEQTAAQVTAPSFQATLATAKQQYRQADFGGAIASYQQILSSGTATDRVEALLQLAEMDLWMQKRPIAETKIQQALKLAKETGNRQGEGRSLLMLAAVERYRENYAKATELLNQALPMLQGDREGEARVYLQFGIVDHAQKQFPQALEKFQTALKTAQAGNHQDVVANCYDWLAETQRSLKNIPQAEVLIQQQQELSRSIGDRLGEYDGLTTLRELRKEQKRVDQAINAGQKQLAIAQSANNPWLQRNSLLEIGFIYADQKQVEKGIEFYQQALTIAQTIDDDAIGFVQNRIGVVYYRAENYPQALAVFQKSLVNYQKIQNQVEVIQVLENIASTYQAQKKYPEALENYQQALAIAESTKTNTKQAKLWRSISGVYSLQGWKFHKLKDFVQAETFGNQGLVAAKQSLVVAKALANPELQYLAQEEIIAAEDFLGDVSYAVGEFSKALERHQQALKSSQQILVLVQKLDQPNRVKQVWFRIYLIYRGIISAHGRLGQHEEEIALLPKLKSAAQKSDNPRAEEGYREEEYSSYLALANSLAQPDQYDLFLSANAKVLEIIKQQKQQAPNLKVKQQLEATEQQQLTRTAQTYLFRGQYPQALAIFQQVLQYSQQARTNQYRWWALAGIAAIYERQGNYSEALNYNKQALAIAKEDPRPDSKLSIQNNMAIIDIRQGNYDKAISFWQESLKIAENDYAFFNQTLTPTIVQRICRESGSTVDFFCQQTDRVPKGSDLSYFQEFHQQWRDSARLRIAKAHNSFCVAYNDQAEYTKAIESCQKAIGLAQELKDQNIEAISIANLGMVYSTQGNYAQAINVFQKSKAMSQKLKQVDSTINATSMIAQVYQRLGQYEKAISTFQESLEMTRNLKAQGLESAILLVMAQTYSTQGNLEVALDYYQQSQTIVQQNGAIGLQAKIFSGMAEVYVKKSQPQKALPLLQQALKIQEKMGVLRDAAETLNITGQAQAKLAMPNQAQATFQQALALSQNIVDRPTEAQVLANLAVSLTDDQPELAIALYKKSISIYEDIRKGLAPLPKDQQKAYTESIAKTYRGLADLLLKNDRILEAQQILDLLKLQELNDYLRNVRGGTQTINFRKAETELLAKFNNSQTPVSQLMQRLAELQTKPTWTPQETTELNKLYQLQKDLTRDINKFFQENPEVQALRKQLRIEATVPDPELLLQLQRELAQTKNAAIFYPAIFDDRLELILITADAPPLRRTVPLKKADLNRGVNDLLSALSDPESQPKAAAQQLYQWLIAPLEADLKAANITTLIYAPDSNLRYIPLAALHDGTQWLTQRYRFNIITATSITNLDPKPLNAPKILAGAISSDAAQNYTVGNATFNGLPHAKEEVENIAAMVPNTNQFIDRAFDLTTLESRFNGYNILHFATHGYFDIESQEKSFLLFGGQTNGQSQIATLADISNWRLSKVDLVVLSACQTGISDRLPSQKGDGKEILGLGYQFQKSGAKATLSSLWRVSDQGTQVLMAAFYKHLTTGKFSTIAALQQAQTDMIEGDRARLTQLNQNRALTNAISDKPLSHPYYWAPFILIGNGL